MNKSGFMFHKVATIMLLQVGMVTTSFAGTVVYSLVSGNSPNKPVFYKYRDTDRHEQILPRIYGKQRKDKLIQQRSPKISITEAIPGRKPYGEIVRGPGGRVENNKWIFHFREMNKKNVNSITENSHSEGSRF